MAWFSVFAGACSGLVLAALAYAAGWPLWLVLLLYPAAGATLSGLVLLVLWAVSERLHNAKSGTGADSNGPADSKLAGSGLR
ncbi:hypothetical protein [Cribrihabitans pelagius]|uniref:hypothetical protein n=1 Tax=Cribrihabitans pelagius TaxID=1765746 RepID=UPI003B5C4A1A